MKDKLFKKISHVEIIGPFLEVAFNDDDTKGKYYELDRKKNFDKVLKNSPDYEYIINNGIKGIQAEITKTDNTWLISSLKRCN